MPLVRSALAYSFLGANTVTIIQFASTLVIARLLTPEELGVYSVAAVFTALAAILRDFGVTNYLIQLDELSNDVVRAAFGLTILSATVLGVAVLATAQPIADFYRDPRVGDVLTVLAINFFVTPFGAITLAIARRKMRFRALAVVNVVSASVSVGISIALITMGVGPVGLAWGVVAGTITTFLLSLRLRTKETPLLPSLKNCWEIASFGALSSGANMVGQLNVSASDMILGRMLNLEAVGLFNRALSLTQFVTRALGSALNPVLLPWLSQLRRDKQHPRVAYRKVVELTTGFIWPIFTAIAVFNNEIVLVLFGDQWGQSAGLVPYFCVSAALASAYTVCSPLYLSAGRPSANLLIQAVNLPVKIVAIVVLAPAGMYAVAAAWPWVSLVGAASHQLVIKRVADIEFSETLAAVSKSAVLSLAALIASLATQRIIPTDANAIVVLSAGVLIVTPTVTATGFLIKHPLSAEMKSLLSRLKRGTD